MELIQKLSILADAAKYDASCASSGTTRRDSRGGRGMGSAGGMGICHSYAPDGRCISLLKVLLTNFCIYDCAYCVNRSSSSVPRARFTAEEVVRLCLDFYKRNYIEGLFLSSGIIRTSDYTMEQMVRVAKTLRLEHDFRGYIHLKAIPDASPELLQEAGLFADRVSINHELPADRSIRQLAPEKDGRQIRASMGRLHGHIQESRESQKIARKSRSAQGRKKTSSAVMRYAPAGQSTQMIIGADDSNDTRILSTSRALYDRYQMRRVYYSAFSPIPSASPGLPLQAPPLMREHRLYQADWLMRFYGFALDEIAGGSVDAAGMLPLDIDPKLAWALNHREQFPVDINRAPLELLLRVPGIGTRGASRIVRSRRFARLRQDDLPKLGVSLKRAGPFLRTAEANRVADLLERPDLRALLGGGQPQQLSMFQ